MRKRKNHLFIMTTTLRHIYGGRTNSLLQRARLLTENKSQIKNITLLTCNYNPNYEEIYEDYREQGSVNKNIEFLNMYDWFKWTYKSNNETDYFNSFKNIFKKEIENNYLDYIDYHFGSDVYEVNEGKSRHHTYYYKHGVPLYHLSYNKTEKRMGHIDVYLDNDYHSAQRLYINAKGNIHKIRYYKDKLKNNIYRDVFVDDEMNAYLTREYYYKNNKRLTERDLLFKADGLVKIFNTESELFTYWFEQIFDDGDKVISDARVLDKALFGVDKEIKRIFQVHGPHVTIPSSPNPIMKKGFIHLSEEIENENDVIIALTEGQKADMISRYPRLENKIKVIPHCIETNKIKVDYNAVVPKTINIVSRLVPLKRIDHILKAFSKFLIEKPDYTLNIYGHGDAEDDLKELTKELNIEDNVHFKGYTTDVYSVFQAAEFSLLTSEYEGLGLTVLESIANGCPVISYDIKWGPNEIIEDHNGLLVKDGDITGLKDAMVSVTERPFKRKDVAKVNKKFSKQTFLNEWNHILKDE